MAKGRGQQRAKHGRQSDKGRGWVPRFYALLGIACLLLLWEIGHRAYGVLVLPGLGDTALTLWGMIKAGIVGPALAQTASNAISGWLIGLFAGTLAGAFAGLRDEVRFALQPVSVILLGIPAIAWVVLALLWFGGHWAVIFTVSIATAPITFAAATQGIRSLDDDLARMAKSFRTPVSAMLLDVHGPHMLSYLFPRNRHDPCHVVESLDHGGAFLRLGRHRGRVGCGPGAGGYRPDHGLGGGGGSGAGSR